MKPIPNLRIIQITDTHLFGGSGQTLCGLNCHASLEEVIRFARHERRLPAFYLATGDLSQDVSPTSYQVLKRAFAKLRKPVYCLPGNHDQVGVMRRVLKSGRIRVARELKFDHWSLILLDSTKPNSPGGRLRPSEMRRLKIFLRRNRKQNILVVLHHNPIQVGSVWMDRMKVTNGTAFNTLLRRYKNVRGVLFGHIHQDFSKKLDKILYLGSPSTCIQFRPKSSTMELDHKWPGYRWLDLHPDGKIVSGVKRLPGSRLRPDYSIHRY